MMKKLTITLGLILGLSSLSFAQNAEDRIEWLIANKHKLDNVNCLTKKIPTDHFEFTKEQMKVYEDSEENYCYIKWENIRTVESSQDFFYVYSTQTVDKKPIILKFFINDQGNREMFENVITNIAKEKNPNYIIKN